MQSTIASLERLSAASAHNVCPRTPIQQDKHKSRKKSVKNSSSPRIVARSVIIQDVHQLNASAQNKEEPVKKSQNIANSFANSEFLRNNGVNRVNGQNSLSKMKTDTPITDCSIGHNTVV